MWLACIALALCTAQHVIIGGRTGPDPAGQNSSAFYSDLSSAFVPVRQAVPGPIPPGVKRVASVAYSPELGRWVVVGGLVPAGCPCIGLSDNGTDYSPAMTEPSGFVQAYAVAWGYNSEKSSGLFVVVGKSGAGGNHVAFSSDGSVWTATTQTFPLWNHGYDVRYSTFHDRWVVAGNGVSPGAAILYHSSSPTTLWTSASWNGASFFQQAFRVTVSPSNGVWMATGDGPPSSLAYSLDGILWTLLSGPPGHGDNLGVFWAQGFFIVGSMDSRVSVAPDADLLRGVSNPFASSALPPAYVEPLNNFCFDIQSNMYFALGGSSKYLSSIDGARTWSLVPFFQLDSMTEACASRQPSQILTGSFPPSITSIYGNVVVPTSAVVNSTLAIYGSLFVPGTLALGSNANVSIAGSATISGILGTTQGAIFSASARFETTANASLSLTLSAPLPQAVLIATFNSGSTFASVSVSQQSSSVCVEQVLTPTTLSVLVSSNCGGLSLGAKIGIIVGAIVGGILVAVTIALAVRYLRKRRHEEMTAQLKGKVMEDLKG